MKEDDDSPAKEVVLDIPGMFKRHVTIAIDAKRAELRPMVAATIYSGWVAKVGAGVNTTVLMTNAIKEADKLLELLYPYPTEPVDEPKDV